MPYIGTTPTKVVSRQSANVYRYTATAGQTAFTGADLDNNVLACNPADMIVHMNGLRLESTDYTATSTTVTLTTAATAGDEVTVTSFVTFEVADTYTKTVADSRYVNTTGDTMTGNLGIGTNSTSTELTIGAAGTPQIDLFNTTSADVLANLRAEVDVGTGGSLVFQTKRNGNTPVDVIKADSAGRVTMPYQPSFRAGSSSQIYNGTASNAYVVLPTVHHNTGSHYSSSTGKFTAPVDGLYHFSFSGNIIEYNGETGFLYTELMINGSREGIFYLADLPDNEWKLMSWSLTINLLANDYAQVTQSQYSRLDSSSWTQFSGYLIG